MENSSEPNRSISNGSVRNRFVQTLVVPQGRFQLARYPLRTKEQLRAWDAADEYMLHHLHDENLAAPQRPILILNDSCGALATALGTHRPQTLSDSYISQQATFANLLNNQHAPDDICFLHSLAEPTGPFDLVLCKIPKSLAFLEDLLHRIRPHVHPQTRIIGAGMSRHIHTSTIDLFERIIGPTRTSLAEKKARLIFSQPNSALDPGPSPYPTQYRLAGTEYALLNHSNVFSRDSLDIGTRLLLEHLPRSDAQRTIVDLGCGNGVIGLVAATRNPQAALAFVDESFMAVASANANFQAAFGRTREVSFTVGDGLAATAKKSADLILCNPPFHQQQAIDNTAPWRMFQQSYAALKKGGELWVIGNRHLNHHIKLKRIFSHCKTVASSRRFVVLRATKQ